MREECPKCKDKQSFILKNVFGYERIEEWKCNKCCYAEKRKY